MVDISATGASRTVVRKGTGLETPNYGSSCKVKLKVFHQDESVIQEYEEKIVIGEGDSEVSESLDRCLECMHTSEVCVIPYTSDTADKEQSVSSESGLQCEIELLSFCKAKEPWETSPEEKVTLAKHHKTKGTDCFKASKWLCAARRYSQALKQLILIGDQLPENCREEYDQLRVSCLLNLSACQGKMEQYEFVAQNCTKVLAMLPTNIKALFRRGQAFVVLNEFEKAREDLEKALTLDPQNKAVQEQLRVLKQKARLHDQKMSRALGVMFGRKV